MKPYFVLDEIGALYIKDTYVEYDGPVLFTCKDDFEALYLVVASLLTEKTQSWVMVKASHNRINELVNNKITIYDAFKHPEKKLAWLVYYDRESSIDYASCISQENLSDDLLPTIGEYLDIDVQAAFLSPSQVLQVDNVELQQEADRTYKIVSDIDIIVPNPLYPHSIPTSILASTLTNWAGLFQALFLGGKSYQSIMTDHATKYGATEVVAYRAASFGVRFVTTESIIGENLVSDAIEDLYLLLEIDNDAGEIKSFLNNHNVTSIYKYRSFVKALYRSGCSIIFQSAIPHSDNQFCIKLDHEALTKRNIMLNKVVESASEDIILRGSLIGFETNKCDFSFVTEDKKMIMGKISDDVLAACQSNKEQFGIISDGEIYLSRTIEINESTQVEKELYIMNGYIKK